MNTETMNVHKGLVELKILNDRIIKEISSNAFCFTARNNVKQYQGKTIQDFSNEIVAGFNSIQTLINRRNALKRAIVQSNAETKIQIGSNTYTIAEAIWMKNEGVLYLESLKSEIQKQFGKATMQVELENGDKLNNAADAYIASTYGSKDKATLAEAKEARDNYIETNKFNLIDPLNCKKVLDELNEFIDTFKAEVDSALSTSNALTEITFEYEVI